MSAPVDLNIHHHWASHSGAVVRRLFAAVCIIVLAGVGLYAAWSSARQGDFPMALLYVASSMGPATMCAFGYFVRLPEVLGAEVSRDTNRRAYSGRSGGSWP
jgi:hypothetical protein